MELKILTQDADLERNTGKTQRQTGGGERARLEPRHNGLGKHGRERENNAWELRTIRTQIHRGRHRSKDTRKSNHQKLNITTYGLGLNSKLTRRTQTK